MIREGLRNGMWSEKSNLQKDVYDAMAFLKKKMVSYFWRNLRSYKAGLKDCTRLNGRGAFGDWSGG